MALLPLTACAGPSEMDDGQPPAPPPATERPAETSPPAPPTTTPPTARPADAPEAGLKEVFPHVRVDLAKKVVEFDGVVPIDAHNEKTPIVYLEVVVCTPDTKEHETLVMTRALPSHVHAALLLIGLQPGRPGSWRMEDGAFVANAPEGDLLEVELAYRGPDGREIAAPPSEWVVNAETGEPFGAGAGERAGWVFAGSRLRERGGREVYDADGTGLLVGLTTFGSETIAWREVISPDSQVHEPEWIARAERVPPVGTPVTVRLRPARPPAER